MLYVIIIASGVFAEVARQRLAVWSDAAATATNIVANPSLLRVAILFNGAYRDGLIGILRDSTLML